MINLSHSVFGRLKWHFRLHQIYCDYLNNEDDLSGAGRKIELKDNLVVEFNNKASQVKNSEYDQEIPQSQTADKPVAPRGRATQQSPDTRQYVCVHAAFRKLVYTVQYVYILPLEY